MLEYRKDLKLYVGTGDYSNTDMQWSEAGQVWYTSSPYVAYTVDPGMASLQWISNNIKATSRAKPILGVKAPEGLDYYPFQAAGIEHMTDMFRKGAPSVMCADEQGLGKTIQAIGVANELGYRKLLVACPASLRLNWQDELDIWHTHNEGAQALTAGYQVIDHRQSLITSYNLIDKTYGYKPDLVILDEEHYLKNAAAARTQKTLGMSDQMPGVIKGVPTIFLGGTPLPNGKPNELWSVLIKGAPSIIDHKMYMDFINRYCQYTIDNFGEMTIRGARNHVELYNRLRGSGWMLRRLKKDVLKDLPPKIYKMVVFPVDQWTAQILVKEKQFNAQEIREYGVPAGSVFPEIRREMGVAKVPMSVEYIMNLLDGGCEKLVVFCHHLDVIDALERALQKYNPIVVDGRTPQGKRNLMIKQQFQKEPKYRVLIGNEAVEEGHTMTAAHDVVLMEPEWVPGKNDQRADRLHRLTQTHGVLVHILVVERSMDAIILGAAARKTKDIEGILHIR